jgi:predicted phosphodiesterase
MGNGDWVVTGSTLTWKSGETDKVLRIGVVSDIKQVTAGKKASGARFLADFKANKVDLIIIAGDTAEEVEAIEKAVRWFTPGQVPVGVVIGNQ